MDAEKILIPIACSRQWTLTAPYQLHKPFNLFHQCVCRSLCEHVLQLWHLTHLISCEHFISFPVELLIYFLPPIDYGGPDRIINEQC